MDRYIHEQNLLNYRKVLSETTDPAKRQTLLGLLASEEAKIQPLCRADIDERDPKIRPFLPPQF
jgi:hypothetical protein